MLGLLIRRMGPICRIFDKTLLAYDSPAKGMTRLILVFVPFMLFMRYALLNIRF